MPVTARLSKLFYDRLGEEIAQELVDWLNAVDATYRADLRELNELNFARFDAKLEQRLAELHAKLDTKIDKVAGDLNARIDKVDAKIDLVAAQLTATLEQRLGKHARWQIAGWATLLVALLVPIMGLWFRG